MARLAVEYTAEQEVTSLDSSYNSSKWNLGNLIKQRLDAPSFMPPQPVFIGPIINAVARPAEVGAGTANAATYPWVMQFNSALDWVFVIDQNTAAVSRRLHLYEFNRNNSAFSWKGYTNLFFPQTFGGGGGTHAVNGFRMGYDVYNKGQVTVVGNLVTGFGNPVQDGSMRWKIDGLSNGSRIGFGSDDPVNISPTNWYTIQNITGDSSMYLTSTVSSPISVSTNYVIEDLRAYVYTSVTTATSLYNGGLHVAKGLNYNDFTVGGTICGSANLNINPDSSRYVYHLASSSSTGPLPGYYTNLDISACGIMIEPKIDWQTQYVYGLNVWGATASASTRIFKYNVRAPLGTGWMYGTGTSVGAINVSTGISAVAAGTISRTNNGRFGKLRHGPLKDVSSLYFVTTTRVCAARTSDIVDNATAFITYEMQEKPPGTVNTYAATAAIAGIEIASTLDRLLVMTSNAAATHSYVTQFRTDLGPMDHIFLADDKQLDQSLVDPNTTPHVNTLSLYQAPWAEGGMLYTTGTGATAVTNIMHTAPIGVEWTYSSSTNTVGRLISPKFLTPNCNNFVRAYAIRDNYLGNDIIGKRTDALRLSYRTSGIDDNTGGWTAITEPNNLSGAGSSSEIQLMVEFKGITEFCVPARIMALGVIYDDTTTDTHYRLSQVNSNITTKTFAWRFVTPFGTTVPALKITLWDDVGNSPLLTDYTDVSVGTWGKSYNDGGYWGGYDTIDLQSSSTTYIRYTPTALANNTKVRAVLTIK